MDEGMEDTKTTKNEPTEPLIKRIKDWTKDDLQEWLNGYKQGKFSKYINIFSDYDGAEFATLAENQFKDLLPAENKGIAIMMFNAKEELLKALENLQHKDDLVQRTKKYKTDILTSYMKFTVNGEIRDPTGVFFLEPPSANELLAGIYSRKYIMLQGHRGSGKTTKCFYVIEHLLEEFTPIWITMQAGIPVHSEKEFWAEFGKVLTKEITNLHPSITTVVTDPTSFCSIFTEVAERKLPPVVLFLDEFDLLLEGKEEIRVELFNKLRGMKSKRNPEKKDYLYGLQSLIIIGPLSIMQAGRVARSPFNSSDEYPSLYWTKDEVKKLIAKFSDTTGIKLEVPIIEDIFRLTQGHPALTCYCGKRIHESLARGKNFINFKQWHKFALFDLPVDVVYAWTTVGQLKDIIKQEPYFSFLIKYFMYLDDNKEFSDDESLGIARTLTSQGVLSLISSEQTITKEDDSEEDKEEEKEDSKRTFGVASPLIRSIIMHTVASYKKLPRPLPPTLPVNGETLDVKQLLLQALLLFDPQVMRSATGHSWKGNRCADGEVAVKKPVPNEHTYHVELVTVIRQWLPSTWSVATEVNAQKVKSCDIVISLMNNGKQVARYALELCAHVADKDDSNCLQDHYDRASESYSKLTKIKEVWVINFTTRQPAYGYHWSKDASVHVAQVYHNLAWNKAAVVFGTNKNEIISVKI